LTLDPDAESYAGSVDIRVRIAVPTDLVWINATKLALSHARVATGMQGNGEMPAEIVPGNEEAAASASKARRSTMRSRSRARSTHPLSSNTLESG
jgi:hypothetical protein